VSRKGVRRGPHRLAGVQPVPPPGTVSSVRDALFESAGLTLERQADLIRASVSELEAALGAMSTAAPELADPYARVKAAHALLSLVGAFPSRTQGARGTPPVQVNLNVPDWAEPMLRHRIGRDGRLPLPDGRDAAGPGMRAGPQ
jgi:hypothetical protein